MVKIQGKSLKILLIVIGIVVIGLTFATIFFLKRGQVDTEEIVFDPNSIVTESLEEPDETKPKEYEVPADIPKRISIPQLDIDGLIQLVSIDQYGRIAVPSNIYIAGWYVNSVRPGEKGLSIVSGHRNGKTNPGVFYNLEKLKKDDLVTIEYGDDSIREFLVIDVIQIKTEEAKDVMYEKLVGVEKQLVLVTCGGEYDKEMKTYIDRVIVRARGI